MVPRQFRACTSCLVRFRAERCPLCDAESVDLRSATDRKRLADALVAPLPARPADGRVGDVLAFYVRWVAPAVILLAVLVGGWRDRNGRIVAAMAAVLGLVALFPVVALVSSAVLRASNRQPRRPVRVELAREPEPQGTAVTGVIARVRPVDAPLSHTPTAAYRLAGEARGGPVDEAGGGSFTVRLDDGRVLDVDASEAQVRLTVPRDARAVVRPDAALTRLLTDRGLKPREGPVRLVERTLREGDRVRVVVPELEEVAVAEGYRDASAASLRASGADVAIYDDPA